MNTEMTVNPEVHLQVANSQIAAYAIREVHQAAALQQVQMEVEALRLENQRLGLKISILEDELHPPVEVVEENERRASADLPEIEVTT